jgi:demethylmenaquinone methyltransferase/2-methoxy-6-polyprenyl-1,4-benzoquinol methylase
MQRTKLSNVSLHTMAKFAHDTVVPFSESKQNKKEQVTDMFNRIALRYDFFNRFLSLGIDKSWRKKALLQLKKDNPQIMLDIATGTGDVAILAYELLHPEKITGLDISEGMLEIGRKKIAEKGVENEIELMQGDAEKINFPDNYFDAVTVAFGVRNFQILEKGLQEIYRVLKPGGKMVVLEFSRPKIKLFKGLYHFYMNAVAPAVCKIFSGNKDAYAYLDKSARAFPEREDFIEILSGIHFREMYFKALTMGICCVYVAKK